MSIGNLSAAGFISWLTKKAADNGEFFYTTVEDNEKISAIEWYNKNNLNKRIIKQLRVNSFTFEAPQDNLMIFPLRKMDDEPDFGILVESGKAYMLKGIQFDGFMVYGPAGQAVRFYPDVF